MKKQRRVTVDEVSLNVVCVSIKAIQLGKKQMTLSVFRQLPNAAVWDPIDVRPLGVIWGRVNYFWSDCGCSNSGYVYRSDKSGRRPRLIHAIGASKNKHIIWEADGALYRSCVSRSHGEARSGYLFFRPETADKPYRGSFDKARDAWRDFYDKHVVTAEQLFIAV